MRPPRDLRDRAGNAGVPGGVAGEARRPLGQNERGAGDGRHAPLHDGHDERLQGAPRHGRVHTVLLRRVSGEQRHGRAYPLPRIRSGHTAPVRRHGQRLALSRPGAVLPQVLRGRRRLHRSW